MAAMVGPDISCFELSKVPSISRAKSEYFINYIPSFQNFDPVKYIIRSMPAPVKNRTGLSRSKSKLISVVKTSAPSLIYIQLEAVKQKSKSRFQSKTSDYEVGEE